MGQVLYMEPYAYESWTRRLELQLKARDHREVHGASVAMEAMMTALGEPVYTLSQEALAEWAKDKSAQMVEKIKSVVGGLKAKLDGVLQKLGLKEKQLEEDPYSTYVLHASPETVNSGITAGKIALVAAGVLAGYFVVRMVGTTVKVHNVVGRKREKAEKDDEVRRTAADKELAKTKEARDAKKMTGVSGSTLAVMSESYKAKRELALRNYNAKKAEFENKLAKELHADHDRIEAYKDKASNRFAYYWSARQIKNAIVGLKTLIDATFSELTKFIRGFVGSFQQRPTGLGRVGLFRWIMRVTRDLIKLVGSSLWSVISRVSSAIFGASKGKKEEEPKA